MKNMNLIRNAAVLCAGILLMTSSSVVVNAESVASPTEIRTNIRINVNDAWLYCNEDTGTWFDAKGTLLTDKTAHQQTALYEGNTYNVDLDRMEVTSEDGDVNEELSALLPTYLSYRPLSFYGIDGIYFDELYGTDAYDAACEHAQEIAASLPLTYVFDHTSDPFVCYVYMPNAETYFAGMQYSVDANDYPEVVPFCNAGTMNIETGNYTLPETAPTDTNAKVKDKTITKIYLNDAYFYCDESTGNWFDAEGNPLTENTKRQQTALYEGTTYTVDLEQMKVLSEDGTVNEELTAMLPIYLDYRPVGVYGIDGTYIDEMYGTKEFDAAYERAQEIAASLPLTYAFDHTSDPFVCYVYMPNAETYFAGMQYSVDANEFPEMVPFCNAYAGSMNIESDYLVTGDVNINSEVDVADAVLMARIIGGDTSAPASRLGLELMDINHDNYKNAADLTAILRKLARLEP